LIISIHCYVLFDMPYAFTCRAQWPLASDRNNFLGVLHGEEQEAHVEVEVHVEQEAPEEEDGGGDDSEEEEDAGQGEANSRSTTCWLNFNSIYIHFCMK
jgi:hypothetical protein